MSLDLLQRIPELVTRIENLERAIGAVPAATVAPAPAPESSGAGPTHPEPTHPPKEDVALDHVTIDALAVPGTVSDATGLAHWQALLGLPLAFIGGQNDHLKIDTQGAALQFTAKNELGEVATITINGAIDVDQKF